MIYKSHNYVFCSADAMEEITSINTFSKFNGRYDEFVFGLDKEKKHYLVLFNTRTDFPRETIYEFVEKYTDTRWMCVDSEGTKEDLYIWNTNSICHQERKMINGFSPREISINYSADGIAPILKLFITDKKIVIECILSNECIDIDITKAQARKILNYIELIVSTTVERRKGYYKYYMPTRRYLSTELNVYWDGWHFDFLPTSDPNIRNNLVICGESLYKRLMKYIVPMIPNLESEKRYIEELIIFLWKQELNIMIH